MRLYTTPAGEWAGTQADAKKLGAYDEVDVPTVKADLLAFLNKHKVNNQSGTPLETKVVKPTEPAVPAKPSEPAEPRTMKEFSWDEFYTIKNHLETCNRETVFRTMNLAIRRYHELDGVEE